MHASRNPEGIPAPVGRYVHQIEVSSPGRILFISGQIGIRPDGSVPADPVEQLDIAMDYVMKNIAAAGLRPISLTKLTTYVVGELDPAGRRAVLDKHLGEHISCSTLVFVAGLARPELKVEVDAWAAS
jgi:enamine deaminase RidA (YjgF/YER057c/UK114 family)